MGTHWPKPGLNAVGEYQVSGHAFAIPSTGGAGNRRVDLDFVASGVTVCNATATDKVTFFDANGLEKHVVLGAAGSHNFNVKFIRIQLTGSANIGAVCQMTNIPAADFVALPYNSYGSVS